MLPLAVSLGHGLGASQGRTAPVGKLYSLSIRWIASGGNPLEKLYSSSRHENCFIAINRHRYPSKEPLVNLFRLTAYFAFVQCCLAGAAFAGSIAQIPEPATMGLIALGVGGLAVGRKFRNRK